MIRNNFASIIQTVQIILDGTARGGPCSVCASFILRLLTSTRRSAEHKSFAPIPCSEDQQYTKYDKIIRCYDLSPKQHRLCEFPESWVLAWVVWYDFVGAELMDGLF